jgi:hypothetical protein
MVGKMLIVTKKNEFFMTNQKTSWCHSLIKFSNPENFGVGERRFHRLKLSQLAQIMGRYVNRKRKKRPGIRKR